MKAITYSHYTVIKNLVQMKDEDGSDKLTADPQLWLCTVLGLKWDKVQLTGEPGEMRTFRCYTFMPCIHPAIQQAMDAKSKCPRCGTQTCPEAPACSSCYAQDQENEFYGRSEA